MFWGRNRPASARHRASTVRRLRTNVCSAVYAPFLSNHPALQPRCRGSRHVPHANAWQPTRKCAAHGFVSRACTFGQCRKTTAYASACPSSFQKLSRYGAPYPRIGILRGLLHGIGRNAFVGVVQSFPCFSGRSFSPRSSRRRRLPRPSQRRLCPAQQRPSLNTKAMRK